MVHGVGTDRTPPAVKKESVRGCAPSVPVIHSAPDGFVIHSVFASIFGHKRAYARIIVEHGMRLGHALLRHLRGRDRDVGARLPDLGRGLAVPTKPQNIFARCQCHRKGDWLCWKLNNFGVIMIYKCHISNILILIGA